MSPKPANSINAFLKSETSTTVALAAVLLLAILFSVFTIIQVEYVPEWKEEAEYAHMNEVLGEMSQLKSGIDSLSVFMKTVNMSHTNRSKSLTGSESSISVPISMGGGELPIIGSLKSGGALRLKNNWGRLELFTGKALLDLDCGSVTYYSQNNYYIDQSFCYENGALILSQEESSVMKLNPSFLNFKKRKDGRRDVFLNTINLTGKNESFSGNLESGIKLSAEKIEFKDPINVTETGFSFTLYTEYPTAWANYLKATAKKAELREEDYEIKGEPNLRFVSFDFKNGSAVQHLYVCDTRVGSELQSGSQNTEIDFTGPETTKKPPIARFKANKTSGFAPFTVRFTDLSENAPAAWSWNFGDGSPWFNTTNPNKKNPSYTFKQAGTYTVSLRVRNANGTDSKIKKNYIKVREGKLPLLELNRWYTFSHVTSPDLTGPGKDSELIEKLRFPDKATAFSESSGNYDVFLPGYRKNNSFYHHFDKGGLELNFDFAGYYSGFNGTPDSVSLRMVYKTDKLNNKNNLLLAGEKLEGLNPWDYSGKDWYLYNRTFKGLNLQEISELVFKLELEANGNKNIQIDYLAVCLRNENEPALEPDMPKANFVANPSSGPAPLTVSFTDTSEGAPISWIWDFNGDGSQDSSKQNPVYTYNLAGDYTAKLSIEDSNHHSSLKTKKISVEKRSEAGQGDHIVLRKENKGGIMPSEAYIEFKNKDKDSYIIYQDYKKNKKRLNLKENAWIKLVMDGVQIAGEADMTDKTITNYKFKVRILCNGEELGKGKIETIWIGKYSDFNSNLSYNLPTYTSETFLEVNGDELISSYPENNAKINLSNIRPYPNNGFLRIFFNPNYTEFKCKGTYEFS